MKSDTVLITGATGHLGFRVLVLALEAGYHARVAVRNQAGFEKILAAPSIRALRSETNLTSIIVPEITSEGAYDEAVKDVQYIIHCAARITSGITSQFEELIIAPAVNGTIGILKSAQSSPSVKRVIITSSIAAMIPAQAFFNGSEEIFDGQMEISPQQPPYPSEIHAYVDGKVRALAATRAFVTEQRPRFDFINIMPTYIIGKNELTTLPDFMKGTNRAVFAQVLGTKNPKPLLGAAVYLNDAAKIHVLALNPSIAGNQSFPATSGGLDGTFYGDAIDIIARKFPQEVADGVLPNHGSQPSLKMRIDVSKTENTFGMRFEGLETQVEEVARHYLELVKESQRA
jgi:nucleoside-diphosphate-sugar epimerase